MYLLKFLSILGIFSIIDYIWLAIVAKDFNKNALGSLLSDKIKIVPTILVYLLIASCIFFIISKSPDPIQALKYGALFGFVVYAFYELTNLSFVANWPVRLALVDILWGTFVFGLVSFVVKYLFR